MRNRHEKEREKEKKGGRGGEGEGGSMRCRGSIFVICRTDHIPFVCTPPVSKWHEQWEMLLLFHIHSLLPNPPLLCNADLRCFLLRQALGYLVSKNLIESEPRGAMLFSRMAAESMCSIEKER